MTKSSDEPIRVVDRRWWARQESDTATAAPEPERDRKPSYVEDLERQLADKTTHLQAIAVEHRRALEEFEQAKLRIRREVVRDVERSKRAVVSDLLEVLDNLDRAIAAARESDAPAGTLLRGVELVRDQFLAKLEALGMAPVSDPSQDGRVVAVAREGYAISDELLRPASVVVGRLDG